MKGPLRLAVISALVALLPGLFLVLGGLLASALGCEVDESTVQPCWLWGMDLGGFLYAALVSGWLLMLSVPLGVLGLLGAATWAIWAWGRHPGHSGR